MNNSLIEDLLQELTEAKSELDLTNNDIAELWDTSEKCIQEWERGIVDIRYVGALRAAVATLYAEKNLQQLDKDIEENRESTRKFFGLTGTAKYRDGKLVIKPFTDKK